MDAITVKEKAAEFGADLCGIASIERFNVCAEAGQLSQQNNPTVLLPGAQSVIVVAKRFLRGTARVSDTVSYTVVRNWISSEMDRITIQLATAIEDDEPSTALPTGAIGPDTWNAGINKITGMISLKNAAHLAGLGVIGKNTLLLTPQYGNMVWLGAVITTAKFEPDQMIPPERNPCKKNCSLCIDSCPSHALDDRRVDTNGNSHSPFINQNACLQHAFGEPTSGGEWRIKCHTCRSVCPFSEKGFTV